MKFSVERAMKPELKFTKGAELRRFVDRIDIADPHHLTVHLKSRYPGLLEWSTQQLKIVPKAYVEKVGDAEFAKHPIGAGPFKWVDYRQDAFVRVEAVADHYRKAPSVKTVEMRFIQEPATIVAMLKAGEADIAQIPTSNIPEVESDPNLRVIWSKFVYAPCLVFCDLRFLNEPSPFQDVRVRQAASLAINRKAITQNLLHGAAEPWGDIIAPYEPGYDPSIKADPYDPQKAKALLKEAGYPNGFDTTFTYGFLDDKEQAQSIASDLAKVGIRCKLVELEFETYVNNFREHKFHGLTISSTPFWEGMTHPGVALMSTINSQSMWSYVDAPKTEAAWLKLYGLTGDKAIAAQAREVSRIWRESMVRSVLWVMHQPIGLSSRVKSYAPIPGRKQIDNLEYMELK